MYHVDPEVMSFMVAVLMACITAYISIVKKVLRKRKPISKLWLSNEIMVCLLTLMVSLQIYPSISELLPAFVTKAVFASVCVHMGSRLIIMLEERATRAIAGN